MLISKKLIRLEHVKRWTRLWAAVYCLFHIQYIWQFISFSPLRYGGRPFGPPFFQKPNSQKNLKCQKSEKIPIPPLRPFLCKLCFNFNQNHLVCLQNAFEKTYPESRSPKGSCHILPWLEVYILQNYIKSGRPRFGPCVRKETIVKCSRMWGRGARKREREVLAIQVLNCRQKGGWGRELPTSVWRQFPAPSCGWAEISLYPIQCVWDTLTG